MECSNSSSEITALGELLGAEPGRSLAETIARCAPHFGPYLSHALPRFAAAFERGEATAERTRELADRLRAARFPATVSTVERLARAARGAGVKEGSATRDALALCLAPLVALGGVRTVRGPRPFADALRRAAIIDEDEANVVFAVARQFDRPGNLRYSTHLVLDELWSGARTPAALRRALAHRARSRGLKMREHRLPPQHFGSNLVPLVTVGDVRIGLGRAKRPLRPNEVLIELDDRLPPAGAAAQVWVDGTATVGNARARELVPWLIDEPAGVA